MSDDLTVWRSKALHLLLALVGMLAFWALVGVLVL